MGLAVAVAGVLFLINGIMVYGQAENAIQQIYALVSLGFGAVLLGIALCLVTLGSIRHHAKRTAEVMERMEQVWRGTGEGEEEGEDRT